MSCIFCGNWTPKVQYFTITYNLCLECVKNLHSKKLYNPNGVWEDNYFLTETLKIIELIERTERAIELGENIDQLWERLTGHAK